MGGHAKGFSLLELLLVLTLVGMIGGVVTPRLMSWVDGAQARNQAASVASALEALPAQAFFEGRPRIIDAQASAAELLGVPPDWRLEVLSPIRYEANGMTAGGRIRLWEDGQLRADWRIQPPAGAVSAVRLENPIDHTEHAH